MSTTTQLRDFGSGSLEPESDLPHLFHQLNNQLGIVLAHAELLEVKAVHEGNSARASQLVASTVDAMRTAREIRARICITDG